MKYATLQFLILGIPSYSQIDLLKKVGFEYFSAAIIGESHPNYYNAEIAFSEAIFMYAAMKSRIEWTGESYVITPIHY